MSGGNNSSQRSGNTRGRKPNENQELQGQGSTQQIKRAPTGTPASEKTKAKVPKQNRGQDVKNASSENEVLNLKNRFDGLSDSDTEIQPGGDQMAQMDTTRPRQISKVAQEILDNLPDIMPAIFREVLPLIRQEINAESFIKKIEDSVVKRLETRQNAQISKMSMTMDDLRQDSKNDRIIVHGLPEDDDVETTMSEITTKMDVTLSDSDYEHFRLGNKRPTINGQTPKPRPVVLKFKKISTKTGIMIAKGKVRRELKDKNILLAEDLTKARREMLTIVRSRYPGAHSRNGTICFYKSSNDTNRDLIFVRSPNSLYEHGFEVEEIEQCERAFLRG